MNGSMNPGEAFNTLHALKAGAKDGRTSRSLVWLSVAVVAGFVLLCVVVALLD